MAQQSVVPAPGFQEHIILLQLARGLGVECITILTIAGPNSGLAQAHPQDKVVSEKAWRISSGQRSWSVRRLSPFPFIALSGTECSSVTADSMIKIRLSTQRYSKDK